MTSTWRCWGWKLGIASSLAMGGAIAASGDCALAQITPDGTLGAESSAVTPTNIDGLPTEQIDGGATRGANLLHSFEKFSVPTGSAAYFNNAVDIQNIISRVTGGSISNIDGLIRANGTANLFLLNPNGIIFGPNAALNIGGSFLGSTASNINFADGTQFSATAHPTTPLLTVSVPIGLQFGGTAGNILNQSRATNSSGELVNLQVQPGETLALLGGDVRLDGGILQAPGGRVELGGLAGAGTVGLNVDGNNLRLSFPNELARADVFLTNSGNNTAGINVAASNGGSVAINARNIDISGSSALLGGLETGLRFPGAQAGDIELRAQGAINIANSSISNNVRDRAVGKGGNISITTGSLSVTNDAHLNASTFGRGDAGSVTITASGPVSFNGVGSNRPSGAGSQVGPGAVGKGGNVNVTARSLSLTNGTELVANTFGQGDAGSVTITANNVSFDGVGSNRRPSGAGSQVGPGAVGKGGNVNVTAGSLSLTNGAELGASTFGQGDAGSVTITASGSVSFDGVGSNGYSSGAFSIVANYVEYGAVGKGGNINVTAGSLSLTNGAQLSTNTFGQGNAGSVTITASDTVSFDGVGSNSYSSGAFSQVSPGAIGKGGNVNVTAGSLSLTNGAELGASTFGQGDAGSVTVTASGPISFDGVGSNGYSSGAFSNVERQGMGKGGNVNVTAGSLSLTNGADLGASTFEQGDAGSVTITTSDTVSFDGDGSNAFSTVEKGAEGKGGGINITTGSLSLTNGAELLAYTDGQGDAGSVSILAHDTVSFDGIGSFSSGVFNTVDPGAVGNGGGIDITTGSLALTNGARLIASSVGSGAAGNIEVSASSIRLEKQAFLRSDTIGGQGNIILSSEDLVLRRSSNITTNATGTAKGGNITIDIGVIVALEDSDITANASEGPGGRVIIDAQGIFGTQFRRNQLTRESDITASSNLGPQFSGTVEINTPDVDPAQGLVNLPAQLVDASGLIAQGCPGGGGQGQSEFIVTGRGGLPPNSSEALSSEPVQVDWVTLNPKVENRSSPDVSTNLTALAPAPLVEAQGWMINAKGEVVLTAQAPSVTPHSSWLPPTSCHPPESVPGN